MPEIGIVITDDHPIVRDGLAQLFGSEPGFAVLALCGCGEEMLRELARHRPDVLVLDARLPDCDGIDWLPDIAAASPRTRIVVFAAMLEEERVVEALRRGASAVVLKDARATDLVGCVRAVVAGEAWVAPAHNGEEPLPEAAAAGAASLSRREREIAEMVARGARNKEIAFRLGLSEGTVKLHISRAFRKLRVGNRVGLSRLFARRV